MEVPVLSLPENKDVTCEKESHIEMMKERTDEVVGGRRCGGDDSGSSNDEWRR